MKEDFDPLFDDPMCSCGKLRLPILGDSESPWLIVWEKPSESDIAQGKFVSREYGMFCKEAERAGLSLRNIRQSVLYGHPNPKDVCRTDSLEWLMPEITKSKAVLGIGAMVCKELSGNSKIQMALKTRCVWDNRVTLITCVSPGVVFVRSPGEFQLALKKFAKEINNE